MQEDGNDDSRPGTLIYNEINSRSKPLTPELSFFVIYQSTLFSLRLFIM